MPGGTIRIDGDVQPLKRALDDGKSAMASFEAAVNSTFRSLEGALANIGTTMKQLSDTAGQLRFALDLIGAAAGATVLVQAYNLVRDASKEWGDVAEDARRRAMTPEFLQEIKFAAVQMGTPVSSASDALKDFRVKLVDIQTEGSKAAKSLKELNEPLYDVLSVKGVKPETAIYAIADAMKALNDPTKQVSLAVELFGSAHADMVHVLSGGADALDTWAQKARAAGEIMDNETAHKARNLREALERLGDTSVWKTIEHYAISLADQLARALGSLQAMSTIDIRVKMDSAKQEIDQLQSKISDVMKLRAVDPTAGTAGGGEQDWLTRLAYLGETATIHLEKLRSAEAGARQEARVRELFPEMFPSAEGNLQVMTARLDQLLAKYTEYQAVVGEREGRDARKDAIDLLAAKGAEAPKEVSTDVGDRWADELQKRTLKATQQMFAAIEFEREQDLNKLDEYLAAGTISHEQAARARLAIEAKYAAEMQKEWAKQIQPITSAISSDLERAFDDWVRKGKFSWQDLANSILADIAKIALRMAVLQPLFGGGSTAGGGLVGEATSGLAGLLGSAQGNVFDTGNVVPFARGGIIERPSIFGMRDGTTGLMGEAGPEAIVPLSRAKDGRLGVAMTGGGQSVNVHFTVNASDAESFRRSEGQITAMLRRAVARGGRGS